MNATLLRGLVALVPACVLLSGSIILFSKGKGLPREGAKRDDDLTLNTAEPCPSEVVTGARHRDGTVWTAAAFVGSTKGDHFDNVFDQIGKKRRSRRAWARGRRRNQRTRS
jgi:hypothetical protein